jgi:dipeptidyl aminopeptidase/acylaminoacyl peptidase
MKRYMPKLLLTSCLTFVISIGFSQKKLIDPSVYNTWKKIEGSTVSNNGEFITYEINPNQGDGWLYLYHVATEKTDSFPRGKDAKFSANSDYFVYKITPGFDTLRQCELQKIDKKKWPKDTLVIHSLNPFSTEKIPGLKSIHVQEENNWLTYVLDNNTLPEEIKPQKNRVRKPLFGAFRKKKNKHAKTKTPTSDGKILALVNPITGKKFHYKDVTNHHLSEKGQHLVFTTHHKTTADSFQLHIVNLTTGQKNTIPENYTAISGLTVDKQSNYLAYFGSLDTSKAKVYSLNLYDLTSGIRTRLDSTSIGIPKGKSVSENRESLFTTDGSYVYFGVAETPKTPEKDTLLEKEKVKLDIWHYQDKRLQSQQLVELKRDEKKTDLYVYHLKNGKIVPLSNDTLTVRPKEKNAGNYLFGYSNESYKIQSQWDVLNPQDHYRISLVDGSVELIRKKVAFDGYLSPTGAYYSYFNEQKGHYFLRDNSTKIETCISCNTKSINWQEDVNGMPMYASPFGTLGYTRGEKELFIQSQYDIWKYDIPTQKLSCVTEQEGEERKIRLTLHKWENDSIYIDYSNVYVEGFNEQTKGAHLFYFVQHNDHIDLQEKYATPHKFVQFQQSKNRSTILFRKMSLHDYPEVRYTRTNFETEHAISRTNPQQSEYNWANVQLVKWKSYAGEDLEGLFYTPENYDATKKYPLLVYFYELYSDDLHNHYAPKPTASIIYATEYASAGYCVFIPDIRYKTGYPAQSAYDCILSGTDYILRKFPSIDSTRMGLQGQSWGGYQTAQLITMTNRYAAAMAGAPVSNMFSAYGGIRWGSGMNRQFQYEKTQSRIGKTIWEAPELYFANSPIFHLPKVKTPLLIMHNDNDGAVPWYQGIELFTGMRRLGKPCWMLNYNGDDHNLMRTANRMDLSIRMRQFFDYYLQGKPAPKWLMEGVPAIEKGKTNH